MTGERSKPSMNEKHRIGFFIKIVLICVTVFMVVKITDMHMELRDLREAEALLRDQVDMHELSIEELKEQLRQPLNEETIKRFAREKLNLRDPGDMLFVSDLPE